MLEPHFSSIDESRRFGAACFCGFLEDTVEVEHCLVIPAIASVRRLPYDIPERAEQDLYRLATDEGFHAEQSQRFLTDLRSQFGLGRPPDRTGPLFLRRLASQRSQEPDASQREIVTVLNGVVTETRISIELGKFAGDSRLAESVRTICRTHADDESIHASQFKALGRWLWEEFDEGARAAAAKAFTASAIARNLPDVERLSRYFAQATGRTPAESESLVHSLYTEDVQIEELQVSARPTWSFLSDLGVDQYVSFAAALTAERARLHEEMAAR
ncbi:MAG: diiron oxygenase [Acidobacteria bacterium]|nr:diiron oxygenase [Acidobacteriota bacterium]MBV9477420.1 diiron oxygenase [Acidobacteriota bacterium]